ncbi:MAG TPA: T9SS type A sorting domain-containing protein, partial [Bacteroidales bacterium]|nr:T9SS type A sorting domain-containing protein [Bacteroidales bacterium]
ICAHTSITLDAGNPGATYLWSTGATTQTIVVDSTGIGIGAANFWVQVTDNNGCTGTDEITIDFKDCTGIYDMSSTWSFDVHPNPSSGEIKLQLETQNRNPVTISIVNSLGKKVAVLNNVIVAPTYSVELNLAKYGSGIYFLRIDGNDVNLSKKIIIQ